MLRGTDERQERRQEGALEVGVGVDPVEQRLDDGERVGIVSPVLSSSATKGRTISSSSCLPYS